MKILSPYSVYANYTASLPNIFYGGDSFLTFLIKLIQNTAGTPVVLISVPNSEIARGKWQR